MQDSDTFVNQRSVEVFDFANSQVSGTFPIDEFLNMPYLKKIWWDSSPVTGSLPTEMGLLSNILHIGIYSARMTGTIPTEIGELKLLEKFILYDNELLGSIPSELGMLAKVIDLQLDENSLTGSVPTELGGLSNLEVLYLNSNSLEGSVTDLNFVSQELYLLNLEDNWLLTGEVPPVLCRLDELYFDCSNTLCGCMSCACSSEAEFTNASLPFSGNETNTTHDGSDFDSGSSNDDGIP